ncbi:hypothetical protein J2810_001951 [Chryseobacterium rhizosphaerae]|nr:hypothetical protein [Chryseobacterium rhizosphaerae]MDR6545900.1 hypothetical protein [Chryseobacterium rhizosphaerae]
MIVDAKKISPKRLIDGILSYTGSIIVNDGSINPTLPIAIS